MPPSGTRLGPCPGRQERRCPPHRSDRVRKTLRYSLRSRLVRTTLVQVLDPDLAQHLARSTTQTSTCHRGGRPPPPVDTTAPRPPGFAPPPSRMHVAMRESSWHWRLRYRRIVQANAWPSRHPAACQPLANSTSQATPWRPDRQPRQPVPTPENGRGSPRRYRRMTRSLRLLSGCPSWPRRKLPFGRSCQLRTGIPPLMAPNFTAVAAVRAQRTPTLNASSPAHGTPSSVSCLFGHV